MGRLDTWPRAVLVGGGGEPLARLRVAATPRARLLGLALLREPPAEGLLIPGARSVHTCGMRFALDVVFLDAAGVVAVRPAVAPWRAVACRAARAVVELPAGAVALEPGMAVAVVTGGRKKRGQRAHRRGLPRA